MTELRLVAPDPESEGGLEPDGPFSAGTPLPRRLPPGRHGIPANLVTRHQRLRLLAAMAEALAVHGYADVTTTHVSELANVSTSTFYKHFGNLWDCVLAAYVAAGDRLCAEIEVACASHEPLDEPLAAGVDAALTLFAAEPHQGQLLSLRPPIEAGAIAAARRILMSRLAAMLRRGRDPDETGPRPPGLDERMIDATLTFVGTRISSGEAEDLLDLGPELVAILDRPRCAA